MHAGQPSRPRREPWFEASDDPRLWAFLGEFPAAGLALGAWITAGRDERAAGRPDATPPAQGAGGR